MNTDLINRLRTHIYATSEAKNLAAEIIQLLERNYPCHAKFTFIGVANNVIGDIAKAAGLSIYREDDFYGVSIDQLNERTHQVSITITSTIQPN